VLSADQIISAAAGTAYFDDGHYIVSRVFELGHVDIEVIECIAFSFIENQASPLSNGVDTSKISGRF